MVGIYLLDATRMEISRRGYLGCGNHSPSFSLTNQEIFALRRSIHTYVPTFAYRNVEDMWNGCEQESIMHYGENWEDNDQSFIRASQVFGRGHFDRSPSSSWKAEEPCVWRENSRQRKRERRQLGSVEWKEGKWGRDSRDRPLDWWNNVL